MTTTYEADTRHTTVSVGAGEVSDPVYVAPVCVITATPGAGGTMKVEATWSSVPTVAAGAARWFTWDQGTAGVVSTKALQLLQSATAVRFTTTTAAGVGEVAR